MSLIQYKRVHVNLMVFPEPILGYVSRRVNGVLTILTHPPTLTQNRKLL